MIGFPETQHLYTKRKKAAAPRFFREATTLLSYQIYFILPHLMTHKESCHSHRQLIRYLLPLYDIPYKVYLTPQSSPDLP